MSKQHSAEFRLAGAAARAIIKQFFGRAPKSLEHKTAGRTNHVFEANTGEGRLIVRMSPDAERLQGFLKEQWAAVRAGEAGIPVPEILETGQSGGGFVFMIQRKTEGREALNHPGSTSAILRKMGTLAAKIHRIKTNGFGATFDWSGNVLSKSGNWAEYLDGGFGLAHRLQVLAKHGAMPAAKMKNLRAAVKDLRAWEGKSTLAHGDLRLKNVIVDEDNEITAIIDWEECHAAPAMLWDLSIALHDLGVDGKEAFLQGYGMAPKKLAEAAPLIKALNLLHYAQALERAVKQRDARRVNWYLARLSGLLDLYSF